MNRQLFRSLSSTERLSCLRPSFILVGRTRQHGNGSGDTGVLAAYSQPESKIPGTWAASGVRAVVPASSGVGGLQGDLVAQPL
jgi:hypothetical protein